MWLIITMLSQIQGCPEGHVYFILNIYDDIWPPKMASATCHVTLLRTPFTRHNRQNPASVNTPVLLCCVTDNPLSSNQTDTLRTIRQSLSSWPAHHIWLCTRLVLHCGMYFSLQGFWTRVLVSYSKSPVVTDILPTKMHQIICDRISHWGIHTPEE